MDDEAIGAYVDGVSAAVQLSIPPQNRQGVIDNMAMILAQSAGLLVLDLTDTEESAAVFHP